MAALSYRMQVRIIPEVVSAGQTVRVEVKLDDVQGEIRSVHGVVSQGGIFETLWPQGDGLYVTTGTVPYDAPPGSYGVYFYATDPQGNRGPEVWTQVTVGS